MLLKKKQIIVIHGGGVFVSYREYINFLKKSKVSLDRKSDWKESLEKKLGKGFKVILPRMPNRNNARYLEWKIWFENFFPFLGKNVVLVGHSLGGIFLTRYLSENKFPKRILTTILVAASYDNRKSETLSSGFVLKKDLSKLQKQSKKLIFFHSRDDKQVPFSSFEEYKKSLPKATFIEFKRRGHFNQSSFPEIVREIKKAFDLNK